MSMTCRHNRWHVDIIACQRQPYKLFSILFSSINKNTSVQWMLMTYARNTPGSICQYKEDGLVSRPPSLFTSMRRPMHGTSCPKSQLKSTCLTAKFGSFLDHAETVEKGQNVISSSVQHPISLIFAMFLLSYLYQWCGFCWQSLCRNLWPQFVYIAFSLDWKINIGVLGTNVATISWLHWSPVSGYTHDHVYNFTCFIWQKKLTTNCIKSHCHF